MRPGYPARAAARLNALVNYDNCDGQIFFAVIAQ
jgi:hypothetical protein